MGGANRPSPSPPAALEGPDRLLVPLATRPTSWDEARVGTPALNVSMDAMLVPTATDGLRVATAHVVALDGVVDDDMRARFLECITREGSDEASGAEPPSETWERRTTDRPPAGDARNDDDQTAADAAAAAAAADDDSRRHWGLRPAAMSHLERTLAVEDWAFLEFHARLAVLFPDHVVCHMPARAMRAPRRDGDGDESFRCDAFVANAATCGDRFAWHVDCDPSSLPSDSAFARAYGDYVNGERNKPLLVSAIVYLNSEWRREWDGETVFLDGASDAGAVVAPRPGRLVLMHQDVWHKVSPPSADAKRPRYSLVWKLALTPKKNDEKAPERGAAASSPRERSTIARPEFGQISPLGSAARLREVFAAIRRRERRDTKDARGVGGEPAARSAAAEDGNRKRTREEDKGRTETSRERREG